VVRSKAGYGFITFARDLQLADYNGFGVVSRGAGSGMPGSCLNTMRQQMLWGDLLLLQVMKQ
jgi:hypothetical protein